MPKITVIAHNIRSTFNVGSIFRTCEGFGVERLILSGYTPYPDLALSRQAPNCAYIEDEICQNDQRLPPTSVMLPDFRPPEEFALLLGEEVNGINPELLGQASTIVEIPMFGQKESFNVSVAAGIALYELAKAAK